MRRRRFLSRVVLGGLTLAGGYLGLKEWGVFSPAPFVLSSAPDQAQVERVVLKSFPYLDLDHDSLRSFSKAYLGFLRTFGRSPSKQDIEEKFLLSTDFFRNGADESQTVRFVSLYDPYYNPCYSPFREA